MNKFFVFILVASFLIVGCTSDSTNSGTTDKTSTSQKGIDSLGNPIPQLSKEQIEAKRAMQDNPDLALTERATSLAKMFCVCSTANSPRGKSVCEVSIGEDVRKILERLPEDKKAFFQNAFDEGKTKCK